MDKVKQQELDRFKEVTEKQKRKIKDLEEENENLLEKNHTLKKEKAELERGLLMGNDKGGSGDLSDFEK